eukprot:4753661-Prymnesium_polylepis.1
MFVVGRASSWSSLPHPLSPVTRSPNIPPQSPSSAQFTPTRGDGDSLLNRRVFVAGEAADRRGVPQGAGEAGQPQKPPIPIPFCTLACPFVPSSAP